MSSADTQLARFLAMADVEAKQTIRKQVHTSVRECKCLACGCEKDRPAMRRGLCIACYGRFRRALFALPKRKRTEFEQEMIREGKILASGKAFEIRNPNPFTRNVG